VLSAEAWRINRDLVRRSPDGVSQLIIGRIVAGEQITPEAESSARAAQPDWQATLLRWVDATSLLALPTLAKLPPRLDVARYPGNRLTLPLNFAGFPALSIPVPTTQGFPASLQLVGPPGGEELLLAAGAHIESAL
jgi:amidase